MPIQKGYSDLLFSLNSASNENVHLSISHKKIIEEASELRSGKLRLFSHHLLYTGYPPNWYINPLNGRQFAHSELHWSRIGDFELDVGDIKNIWELSRFDWALILARTYRLTGDEVYLTFLNEWAADWTEKNPLYMGPNWKCGQETAIRMMQTLLAAYLLHQYRTPTPGLRRFVLEHCRRIAATIRYAIAQNNNHGTSEAAGLYIGGGWLAACCQNDKKRSVKLALRWHQLGRCWLENRLDKLVAPDGSFSQYSLNYHRVLLDTLNIVEFWRRELQLPPFSDLFYERARAAVEWLYQIIDPQTGDGPNLGANDGARLFVLSSTDYRDHRPTVQLGATLFLGGRVYQEGPWDETLFWLGLNQTLHSASTSFHGDNIYSDNLLSSPSPIPSRQGRGRDYKCSGANLRLARKSCIMPDGGYVIMHFPMSDGKVSWGVIRFPNFRFRPGHADALHLDLWYNSVNLLRDAGSYSYNVDEPWQTYFSSTVAHNTVQFDGRDQMPRLGRFLFGEWLRMEQIGELINHDGMLSWTGSYMDYKHCRHTRTLSSNGHVWKIVDEVEGFKTKAVLRWRLAPDKWKVDGLTCIGEFADISCDCSTSISRFELVKGWESRYYMEKTPLPVLEVQIGTGKAKFISEIRLKI